MSVWPVLQVTCPRCGRHTDRVQSFEVPTVVFLIAYIAWAHERIAGCPGCVRQRLWQLFWFSLPAANLFFPIVGPILLVDIWRSHHTDRPGIPAEFAEWANLPLRQPEVVKDTGKWARMVVVVLVLAAVLAGVFFVLPRLAK